MFLLEGFGQSMDLVERGNYRRRAWRVQGKAGDSGPLGFRGSVCSRQFCRSFPHRGFGLSA